jgi:hypothetical protein
MTKNLNPDIRPPGRNSNPKYSKRMKTTGSQFSYIGSEKGVKILYRKLNIFFHTL